MWKKILVFAVSLVLLLGGMVVVVGDESYENGSEIGEALFAGGSGIEEDPYLIENVEELQNMSERLSANYKLIANINASDTEEWNSGYGFEPIGNHESSFTGSLEGGSYTITDLYINRTKIDGVGLFGVIGEEAFVGNITLSDASIKGADSVGGLVGWSRGIILRSSITGDVSGEWYVGGLVGRNTVLGEVESSDFFGSVRGDKKIGSGMLIGGLVGWNNGPVRDSHAVADVVGDRSVGGLVGGNTGSVEDSYSTGTVEGYKRIGGLVGKNSGTVENSHYNIDEVLINADHHITIGGLFEEQYLDWVEDKELSIDDYDSLVPTDDYYEISDIQGIRDLLGFSWNEEYRFRLVSDIDLSGESGLYIPYLGAEIDGNGFEILNLDIDHPLYIPLGFVGHNIDGVVTNLYLVEIYVKGAGEYIGGLVGNNQGTVERSRVFGRVNGNRTTGGLVGKNSGTVENSSVAGDVTGYSTVGGLVGDNRGTIFSSTSEATVNGNGSGGLVGWNWGEISKSYAEGDVKGNSFIGGLVGWVISRGEIQDSYAMGNVSGRGYVGGLVGANGEELEGWGYQVIKNSYATGNVTGKTDVGGLVGRNRWGTVSNSYAVGDVNGVTEVGGLVGKNMWIIENSYATGNVSGNNTIGGLVGDNYAREKNNGNEAVVKNSYAIGQVRGNILIGGLVGNNSGGVKNSFWDLYTSEINVSDGGTGKRTEEMQSIETYTDTTTDGLNEPWDIAKTDDWSGEIWVIDEGESYPRLSDEDDVVEEETVRILLTFIALSFIVISVLITGMIYYKKR